MDLSQACTALQVCLSGNSLGVRLSIVASWLVLCFMLGNPLVWIRRVFMNFLTSDMSGTGGSYNTLYYIKTIFSLISPVDFLLLWKTGTIDIEVISSCANQK
jgi:hypothetical protein